MVVKVHGVKVNCLRCCSGFLGRKQNRPFVLVTIVTASTQGQTGLCCRLGDELSPPSAFPHRMRAAYMLLISRKALLSLPFFKKLPYFKIDLPSRLCGTFLLKQLATWSCASGSFDGVLFLSLSHRKHGEITN